MAGMQTCTPETTGAVTLTGGRVCRPILTAAATLAGPQGMRKDREKKMGLSNPKTAGGFDTRHTLPKVPRRNPFHTR